MKNKQTLLLLIFMLCMGSILPYGQTEMNNVQTNLKVFSTNTFAKTYLMPIFDGGGILGSNKDDFPYIRNLGDSKNPDPIPGKSEEDWQEILDSRQSANLEKDNYWVSHLMGGHQTNMASDADPNFEGGTYGITDTYNFIFSSTDVVKGGNTSVIFRESWIEYKTREQSWIITHEIGHQFGLSHGLIKINSPEIEEANKNNPNHNMGIMVAAPIFNGSNDFIPRYQNIIRSRIKSPGQ